MKKYLLILVAALLLTFGTANADPTAIATGIGTGIANADAGAASFNELNQTWNTPAQPIQNPPIFPMPIPLLQGGRVGDVTDQLPRFKGLLPLKLPRIVENGSVKVLDPGEEVDLDSVQEYSRSIFSRTRLQDLWSHVNKAYKDYCKVVGDGSIKNIRFRVYYKDSSVGSGIGGGAQVGGSGITGAGNAVQGMGAILPGMNRSTADPMYIPVFCLISQK